MRDSEKKSLRTESLWTLKYFNQDLSFRAGNCWICNGISQCFTLRSSQTFINSALHFYAHPYLIKIPLVFSAILIPRKCNSNTKKSNLKCQLSFLSCTNKFHFMTKSAVEKHTSIFIMVTFMFLESYFSKMWIISGLWLFPRKFEAYHDFFMWSVSQIQSIT